MHVEIYAYRLRFYTANSNFHAFDNGVGTRASIFFTPVFHVDFEIASEPCVVLQWWYRSVARPLLNKLIPAEIMGNPKNTRNMLRSVFVVNGKNRLPAARRTVYGLL